MLENTAETHRKAYDIHPLTKQILYKRGLDDQGISNFLSWNLRKLPLLTEMKDMDKASRRIVKAIIQKERMAIYGDYDVDGTTACALLYHFFQMVHTKVELMQPSRFVEGYGLHPSSIDNACSCGIDLLITVDCGITDIKSCHYALEKKIDLIITDHHTDSLDSMLPAYAIVNPNRRDEPQDSPLRFLAGVGVAFALCVKIKEHLHQEGIAMPTLYPLLQFVSIGTICDLVKLTPLNLTLVRHGLRQLPKTNFVGLRSFIKPEERRRKHLSSEKLAFEIGPVLNSKGRLDHPERALKLLIAENNRDAYEQYSHLIMCNQERKHIQQKVFVEAKEQILNQVLGEEHIVSIAYQENWHEGVIGIVASKLVDVFKVPAMVFTNSSETGIIKGSVRSVGQYNIFHALKACEDLFIKFGGHKAAAGLSLEIKNFPLFQERIKKIIRQTPVIERIRQDEYDLEIQPSSISREFLKSLEILEPFGMGNPKPIFKIRKLKIDSFDIIKDTHVRWTFKGHSQGGIVYHRGISFNYLAKWDRSHLDSLFKRQHHAGVNIYTHIGINVFENREFVQFIVNKVEINNS